MVLIIFGLLAVLLLSTGLRNQKLHPSTHDGQRFSAADTLAVFEHPFNHYREAVPRRAWLWMMLFGIFYLMVRQLWVHVAIVAAVIVGCLAVAPWLLLVVGLPLWLFYIGGAAKLIIANYYRRGWRLVALEEVTPELPGAAEGVA